MTDVNKVIYNDGTLIDLTSDTVTAADVAEGVTFHAASGAQMTGTNSGEIFWCTYGTTTYADTLAAYNAGKFVLCKYSDLLYMLSSYDSTGAEFCFGSWTVTTSSSAAYIDMPVLSRSMGWFFTDPNISRDMLPLATTTTKGAMSAADKTKLDGIVDTIYPVGSIYMSVNSTSPATLFGGTWSQIQDTFLLAAGSTYTAGDTGGEATHTLTESEMPSHTHTQAAHSHTITTYYNTNAASGSARNIPAASGTSTATSTRTSGSQRVQNTTPTIDSTGGGSAHNNMPPYLAVYVWQRTA